jgi:hypothetical protein
LHVGDKGARRSENQDDQNFPLMDEPLCKNQLCGFLAACSLPAFFGLRLFQQKKQ